MWTTNIHTGIKQQTTLLYYKITTELMTNKLAMKIEKHYIRKKNECISLPMFLISDGDGSFCAGNSYDNKSWYSTLLPMKTWNLSQTPDSKSKLFSSLDPQTQKSFTWEFDSRSNSRCFKCFYLEDVIRDAFTYSEPSEQAKRRTVSAMNTSQISSWIEPEIGSTASRPVIFFSFVIYNVLHSTEVMNLSFATGTSPYLYTLSVKFLKW